MGELSLIGFIKYGINTYNSGTRITGKCNLTRVLIIACLHSFVEDFTSNVEFDFATHGGFL